MRLDTAQGDEGEQTATTAVEGWRRECGLPHLHRNPSAVIRSDVERG